MESYLSSQRLCEKDAINSRWGHTQLLEVDQGACLWFRCQLYHFKAFVTLDGVYDFEPQFPHKYTRRTSPVCVLWKQGNREKA